MNDGIANWEAAFFLLWAAAGIVGSAFDLPHWLGLAWIALLGCYVLLRRPQG